MLQTLRKTEKKISSKGGEKGGYNLKFQIEHPPCDGVLEVGRSQKENTNGGLTNVYNHSIY